MKLAPIALSTYTRLSHLKKTVAALQKNTLAPQSELFIFSDGPKNGDESKVSDVRNYLRTIDGFKKVKIIESIENAYPENWNQGERMLLDEYGKIIILEEDIITAPSFLQFINQALDTYEYNPKIFSIAGYCPPIKIPRDYPYDVFLLPRFNAWGCGIWKDRFDLIERHLPKEEVDIFINSWKEANDFLLGGPDMLHMLMMENIGKIDAIDVRIFFLQHKLQMDTIYPVGSLVKNIGLDGSGIHSPQSNYWDTDLTLDNKQRIIPHTINRNQKIIMSHFYFRLGPRWYLRPRKVLRFISFMIFSLWKRGQIQ